MTGKALGNIDWTNTRVRLGDLKPWERNPKTISREHANRLLELWEKIGQFQSIAIGPSFEVYDGHQRLNVLKAAYGVDYEVDARQSSRELTEKEREELVVAAHAGTVGQFDWDALSAWDASGLIAWGLDDSLLRDLKRDVTALDLILTAESVENGEVEYEPTYLDEDLPPMADYVFPTDNDYGIPCLDINKQAIALEAPVKRIGQDSRHKETGKLVGTLHFYTDDYKFSSVWGDPFQKVIESASCIVEPNYSTSEIMPVAVALYGIFKKRWLSRLWQEFDKKIIVDLNVDPKFDAINLIGVPKGWRAYSTRYYKRYGLNDLLRQFELACEHAGRSDILFVVFGGSKEAEQACMDHGWTFVKAEYAEVQDGQRNKQ